MKKGYYFSNLQVSQILSSVAAAYEVKKDDRFKIIAYERAADSVEHASNDIKDLWDEGKLDQLAGIGPSIASHLNELFKTGKVRHFNHVLSGLPPAMFELMKISGVGAKTAYKLCQKLKIENPITAVRDLVKAAEQGKIRKIEGFGEESERKIVEAIQEVRRKTQRILLPQASALAEEILNWLRKSKLIVRADPLGSLRRQVSTVGDIDIAVATNSPKDTIKYFISYPKKKKVLEAGKTTASILLKGGEQVDLMVQPTSSYGALLQHLTGSKHHNIALRELALKKGLSLSEYGIATAKTRKGAEGAKKIRKFATEEEFYQALGLDFIPPEMREDTGEIEAAQNHQLPKLIEENEIKGDLHLHSNFPIEESHDPGTDSLEEMIKKAEALNYEYIGFSEHNPSMSNHSEKQIIELLKAKKEKIEQLNYSRTNKLLKRIYNGLEVDVRPDGKLALPGKALELLDYVIASIHSSFRMNSEEMTKRVFEGLSPKKVKILGHPTGRLLNKREGYELNWDKIFDFCLKNDKWLEINAWPARLDLPDSLVREAVKKGVKMIINTDAHSTEEMDLMPFGVSVARRGWAEKGDIVNALNCDKINQEIFRKEVK